MDTSQETPSFLTRRDRIKSQKRGKFFKRVIPLFLVVCLIFLIFEAWTFLSSGTSVFQYALSNTIKVKSTDDRVNVLLLGIGGGKHDGADLTDSIIVASYSLKSHKTTLISIPRDLWLGSIKQKINAAYEIGDSKGSGLQFAEDKIDDILGIPIHYGIRIDFSGFSKAIDQVGGVDVSVARTFDDYNYPITGKENDLCGLQEKEMDITEDQAKQLNLKTGKQKVLVDMSDKIATNEAAFACRFEHIHFDKGTQHMDGSTALKFVRSRHALGIEGSDFARSSRQQLVIQAFRQKALSVQTLTNPKKVIDILNILGSSVDTDIPTDQFLDFYSLVKTLDGTDSIVLGDLGSGKSILINPPPADYGGAYVLTPPQDDFTPVKIYIKQKLEEDSQVVDPKATPAPSVSPSSSPKKP